MSRHKIIRFDPNVRLFKKVDEYIESMELFIEEQDKAIPLLLKALKFADYELKRNIIMLLGGFARDEVVRPLHRMMIDPEEDEEIRHFAAVQLSVTLPFFPERRPWVEKLLDVLKNPEPEMRAHAAFALGWEGNDAAVIPLIELLYDSDIQVQQAAVNALCNLRDDRIFGLMLERLEHGPSEQKQAILYNLWRFYTRRREVETVYLDCLNHEDPDLRLDALVLLSSISPPGAHLPAYQKCLEDDHPGIRALALKRIGEADFKHRATLKEKIKAMLSDPDKAVRQAAARILKPWYSEKTE
jgi:HEAT repeat protein